MGFKEWRERLLARVDARADQLDESARVREVQARAELDAAREARAVEVLEREAARLGVSHEDLVARAVAAGLPPGPEVPGAGERVLEGVDLLRVPALLSETGGGGHGKRDFYREWVTRIEIAERLQGKVARGERLSRADRAVARAAGVSLE